MNYSTAVMLINPAIRAIKGQYEENGNTMTYKTLDQEVKVGDFAIVETSTRWGMSIVKVVEVDVDVDFDSSNKIGWVVGVVNTETHEKIKAMEEQAVALIKAGELRKRREDIRKNSLDAITAGEIENLSIAQIGVEKKA